MQEANQFNFTAKVWIYPGPAPWHFVSLPAQLSAQIQAHFAGLQRGWGSLPVKVTVGQTSWNTSIFFDKKGSSYLLPLKAEVRKKENLTEGAQVDVSIIIKP